jgi:two-component system LytT family response regulator
MMTIDQQAIHKLHVAYRSEKSQEFRLKEKTILTSPSKINDVKKIVFPIKGGVALYRIDEIFYCKAEGNYTKVFLSNGESILLSKTIKSVETCLPDDIFLRCHQSYIINIQHVHQYTAEGGILLDQVNQCIPVSRRKRKSVLAELTTLND